MIAKLGDICTIKGSAEHIATDTAWLLNLDMVEQQTGAVLEYHYVPVSQLTGSIIQFSADNVLYSKLRPNLNKVVLPDRNGFATSEMLPLYPDKNAVCREYLAVFLRSKSFVEWAVSKTAGAKMPRLGTKELLNKELPLPPIPEQQRIVAELDKISALIAKRREQLTKLDELVKSRFVEMFGEFTQTKRLETFAKLITKGASPKWQGVEYTDRGTLFVTSENVRAGYVDLEKQKYLDNRINEIQPRSVLKENDILINIVGASIGRAAIFKCKELANINQAVALVRINVSQINLQFLITYLNSITAMELYDKMKKGGARDNLSLKNIADLPIPVVTIELQNEFAAFVEQTEKLKLTIRQSLDTLETTKKALMQKYFG